MSFLKEHEDDFFEPKMKLMEIPARERTINWEKSILKKSGTCLKSNFSKLNYHNTKSITNSHFYQWPALLKTAHNISSSYS